jgi:hypothetical protein
MVAGIPAKIAKFILFTFNAVFWLSGVLLFIAGIVFLANVKSARLQEFLSENDPSLRVTAGFLILLGLFILVIGFCGCCGAIRESKFLLALYIALLAGLIVAKIALVIFVVVMKNKVERGVAAQFQLLVNDYPPPQDWNETIRNPLKDVVDALQYQVLECCGTQSSEDWKVSKFYTHQTTPPYLSVPPSCCQGIYESWDPPQYKHMLYGSCELTNIPSKFTEGCQGKIENWLRGSYVIFIALLAVIVCIELAGILLALCVYYNIRKYHS